MTMKFFNLHHHTEYSFLDGFGTPQQIMSRLDELQQDGIAVTDHGNIYGHIPFAKAFKKAGKHLVFGCEMYLVGQLRDDRKYYHMTLLAKTDAGYANLLKLVNISYTQFYYKPRITLDQFLEHSKDLVMLSGCFCDGIFVKNEQPDQHVFFKQAMSTFKDVEWYLELQPYEEDRARWDLLLSFAKQYDVPCVVTADSHYPKPEQKPAHDMMLAIHTGKSMSDPDRLKMDFPLHMPSAEEMWTRCTAMGMTGKQASETLQRTYDVAHSCKVSLPKTSVIKIGYSFDKMKKECESELRIRGLQTKEYKDRLKYELEQVSAKGYVDYFYIISDLIQWAKKTMLVGPGRGSSAGSLVCWLLGITNVDPIAYHLYFERFIDPNRSDLPDIDVDFPSVKREYVLEYLKEKYGADRTAQIMTFGTYKPRLIIQDAGRTLDIPRWEISEATSQILERASGDSRANFCLRDSIGQYDKLKALFVKYPKLSDAFDLEGQIQNFGTHAAAVVIANDPLANIVSINKDGILGVDKYYADEVGLLKIDILGLETLSMLMDVSAVVGMDYHEFYTLPLDDKKTFKDVFTPAKLEGVFQFEGLSVKRICREIMPTKFEQIIHISALGRPGTLDSRTTEEYIRRYQMKHQGKASKKQASEAFSKTDPALEKIAEDTLGLLIFQEQIMKVAREIGNMTWKETATIRAAMSKSLGEEFFNQFEQKFIDGAAKNGINAERARNIWRQCYTHGNWSFNKSHAVSYGFISYWTGYMKAHYPAQFYARILKGEGDDLKIRTILREWNGPFLPIDLNKSKADFSTDGKQLIGGWSNIKGIGDKGAARIVSSQPFESIADMRSRVPAKIGESAEEALVNGVPWSDLKPMRERIMEMTGGIDLDGNITSFSEMVKSKMPGGLVGGRVIGVNLKDHNEDKKVQKRGYKMQGYTEYIVLKIDDEEGIWHVVFDRRYTEKNKQGLLPLNGKIVLLRVKRAEENMFLGLKYKALN
jgi:DNA polymerase-3 subunit alpha